MSAIVELALVENEFDDRAGQFFAPIFLQEMTCSGYRRVRLIASPRDRQLEQLLSSFRDGIAIAERGQKRFLPTSEDLPSLTICRHLWILSLVGNEEGKLRRASL